MNNSRDKFIKTYFFKIKQLLDTLENENTKDIKKTMDILLKARSDKKTIFVMGNGGSASTASHIVGDLLKGSIVKGTPRFKAISLTDNIPSMLAWANDTIYEMIFIEQLKNLMGPGDVVIGISGSGNSANVVRAIEYANKNGAVTIGFCGFDGGKLKKVSQHSIHIRSNNMQRVEDLHLLIGHLMTLLIKDESKIKK